MKYQALLDGLECKEVKFSDLFIDNEKFRIDDEFFMKKYIRAYQQTKSNPHFILENEISVLTDFHANGSYETIAENFALLESVDYAYMVRTTDLETNNFTQDVKYISEKSYNFLSKSKVFGGELLINKIGTPGKCYLMPNLNRPVSLGMNLFLLRLKENSLLNEKFLYVFFNTEIGKNIITRKVNGTVPLTIDKMAIKSLLIPKLGADLMENVSNLVDLKFDLDNQSKNKYIEAETLLLENLGLQDFQAICEPVNIKSLKESFLQTGRLDAEFYQEKFDKLELLFNQFERIKLADLVNYLISSGIKPKANGDDYTDKDDGIAFICAVDLQNGEVNLANLNYIKPIIHETTLKRTQLKQNDVLISIAGTVGRCALFTHDIKANINQAVAILRFDENKVNRLYLVAFFNSELGKQYVSKYARQGLQTNLNLTEIGELSIPVPAYSLQIKIADYIRQSNDLRQQAQDLLTQAKNSVEQEIENSNCIENNRSGGGESNYWILLEKSAYFTRLAEWTLLESLLFAQKRNVSIQSFSKSFGASGRLDAEYYQPKFAQLFEQLSNFNTVKLNKIVNLQKSVEPGSEAYQTEGIPFVRVSDLSKFGISQTDKFLNPADFAETIRPKKDSILLTKDGTVGIAYCVPQNLNVITSGAIVHLELKTDDILPDYLALVLNSKAVQLQAERDAGGSIIQHWKPSEILDVVVPVLPKSIQQTISDKVQQSFVLKAESEALLIKAKMIVEQEIENMG